MLILQFYLQINLLVFPSSKLHNVAAYCITNRFFPNKHSVSRLQINHPEMLALDYLKIIIIIIIFPKGPIISQIKFSEM